MGGGVVLRVLAIQPANYIRAAVLYGSMSGDEQRNYERIRYWSYGRRGQFELNAPREELARISPINYLEEINVPLSIHHSLADDVVPAAWSNELCVLLARLNKPHECYFYEAQPHTLIGYADKLFMDRVEFFFKSN